jgi:diguanylate cyclase (GGDEF)-like protein
MPMTRWRQGKGQQVPSEGAQTPAVAVGDEQADVQTGQRIALVIVLSLFLGTLGLLLIDTWAIHGDLIDPIVPAPWWVAIVVGIAFAGAERLVFHIGYRTQALTHTLTEVPLALALVFLGVDEAIIVRAAATLLVLGLVFRTAWYKIVFNLGMQTFVMWVGFFVLHALIGSPHGGGQRLVLALVATLFFLAVVEAAIVLAAIAVFEGGFIVRLRGEIRSGAVRYPAAAVIGSLAAVVAASWPLAALLFLVPILAVWGVMRVHGRTSQRLRDLEELHRVSALFGGTLHRDEVAAVAVREISRLLRAERVTLVLFDRSAAVAEVVCKVGRPFESLPARLDDATWSETVRDSAALIPASSIEEQDPEGDSPEGSLILVPLHDDVGPIGCVIIGDRGGVADDFDEADVVRAEALADRLGLALRNATLHEQIEHEAWHDQLTGLPNRTLLERRLDDLLAQPVAGGVAVLTVGLDRFRDVNSTLGHAVGDVVLTEMAARLRSMIGPGELVARVSGDEFALLARVDCEGDALIAARGVQEVLHAPFLVKGLDISVNTSIGVASDASGSADGSLLLRRADMAMHWAKTNHTNVEFFRAEIDSSAPERLSLLSELRSALDQQQLDVFFQPKLDLVTKTVVGAEALVRWHHPTRGLMSPADFVQMAENTGLISTLTDQVVRRTVSALRLLTDLGFDLTVSVNLSAIDLLDNTIVARIERMLADADVEPAQLTLEITETALLADGVRTLATAEALHRLGTKLSIDDFGTGFSSLSYLRTLPTSELKIDRSFVGNLTLDERDEVIVRSTIDLGHNLGLRVVAEGVEDVGTLDRLRTLGCDLAQGYGISRPLAFDRFLVWLNSCAYPVTRTAGRARAAEVQASAAETAGVVRQIRSAG